MKSYFTISTRFQGKNIEKEKNSEKKSWKYRKLFHNFNQIGKDIEKEKTVEKVGNIESYFTISTRFLGKNVEKEKDSEKKVGNI